MGIGRDAPLRMIEADGGWRTGYGTVCRGRRVAPALATVVPTSTKRVVPDRLFCRCDRGPARIRETTAWIINPGVTHRCGSGIVERAGPANAAIDVVANYTASLSSFAGRKAIFLLALI